MGRIKAILESHLDKIDENATFRINDNISIKLHPSSKRYESIFVLGGLMDYDEGGWVVSEIHENLKIIIKEKTDKIAPHRHKYGIWWLALVDYIGYGISQENLDQLIDPPGPVHDWDKVILVSPLKPSYAVEI